MPATQLAWLIACGLAAGSAGAAAQNGSPSKTQWRGEIGIGAEYDSNVTVDEVDISSGQSDYARVVDLELGAKRKFGERTEGSFNYDLSQSSYSEFSRVDRRTQIVGADLNTDIGRSNLAVSAYYIDAQLDGDPFLKFVRLSPAVSGFLATKWFARGAYVYSEREIEEREQRNANTQTAELDLYYFHRGLRSYWNLGFRYRDEDAVAPELDFEANSLKLRYIRRFELWGRNAKVEAALRYEVRDYSSEEPTIEEEREDDRLRWKLDFELPINDKLSWQWYYSYGDYVSNLPRADFTQTIVGTRLQFGW
ncbi:MAG: hypothetical protein Cons2KO_31630 [Congregibacter sp.]